MVRIGATAGWLAPQYWGGTLSLRPLTPGERTTL